MGYNNVHSFLKKNKNDLTTKKIYIEKRIKLKK